MFIAFSIESATFSGGRAEVGLNPNLFLHANLPLQQYFKLRNHSLIQKTPSDVAFSKLGLWDHELQSPQPKHYAHVSKSLSQTGSCAHSAVITPLCEPLMLLLMINNALHTTTHCSQVCMQSAYAQPLYAVKRVTLFSASWTEHTSRLY